MMMIMMFMTMMIRDSREAQAAQSEFRGKIRLPHR